MQLTVIGCSPAWPNAGGVQSGYLVDGGGRVLLDCGPGVLSRLRELEGGWPGLDALVITHFHLDHWGDLVPWVFGASFGPGRDAPAPALWLPPGGEARLRDFGRDFAFGDTIDRVFDLREYGDAEPFEVGELEIRPFRLEHYSEPTYGLRLTNGSRTLAYSSDTGPTPALAELARDADLFLCEATLDGPEPAERGHLTEEEALTAHRDSGARRLVVIHRPAELPLREGVERAADGDVLTV